jgi:hypothetical protein
MTASDLNCLRIKLLQNITCESDLNVDLVIPPPQTGAHVESLSRCLNQLNNTPLLLNNTITLYSFLLDCCIYLFEYFKSMGIFLLHHIYIVSVCFSWYNEKLDQFYWCMESWNIEVGFGYMRIQKLELLYLGSSNIWVYKKSWIIVEFVSPVTI